MTPASLVIGNPQQMDQVAPGRDFPQLSRYGESVYITGIYMVLHSDTIIVAPGI